MENNKRRNPQKGLTNSGIYYNSPSKVSKNQIVITQFTLQNFNPFLRAFDRLYNLNKTSTSFVMNCIYIIMLYCCIHSCFSTQFTNYLNSHKQTLRCPDFIYAILKKIASEVNSKNNSLGWTHGEMVQDVSLYAMVKSFVDTIKDESCDLSLLFDGSCYETIVTNKRLSSQFRGEAEIFFNAILVKLESESLHSDHLSFELVTEILENISSITRYQDSIPETLHTEISFYSTEFGPYRFRNSRNHQSVFYVPQASCSSVSHSTLEYFAVIFRLLVPTFYQDDIRYENCTSFLAGDSEFDVSSSTCFESWLKLLSYQLVLQPEKGEKKKKGGRNNKFKGQALNHGVDQEKPEVQPGTKNFSSYVVDESVLVCYNEVDNTLTIFESSIKTNKTYFRLDEVNFLDSYDPTLDNFYE